MIWKKKEKFLMNLPRFVYYSCYYYHFVIIIVFLHFAFCLLVHSHLFLSFLPSSPPHHHHHHHHQQEYAEKHGIHFFETSAKNTTNVNQAFLALTSEIRSKFVIVVGGGVVAVGWWWWWGGEEGRKEGNE